MSAPDCKPAQATRARLPSRRAAETFDLQAGGQHYRATIGRFPDSGHLAEIFISNTRAGSEADCNARDASVVASIALQYGVPIDVLRKALMRDARGTPCGPLAVALDLVAEMEGEQ
jgi:ribonucleoside-diphosphate reductase alpha chain